MLLFRSVQIDKLQVPAIQSSTVHLSNIEFCHNLISQNFSTSWAAWVLDVVLATVNLARLSPTNWQWYFSWQAQANSGPGKHYLCILSSLHPSIHPGSLNAKLCIFHRLGKVSKNISSFSLLISKVFTFLDVLDLHLEA